MGYETNRFEQNIEDFECPICKDVLEDPMQINTCEHMFCRLCIIQWANGNVSSSPTCPVDRIPIKDYQLTQTSRFFRMQYNRLKIKCKFIENGCKEIVQMENQMNHEVKCPFNPDLTIDCKDEVKGTIKSELISNMSKGHKNLIEFLKERSRIKSTKVENVMLAVDRSLFCTSLNPYADKAKRNNYGTTISAPHMHASILELLKSRLTTGAKVLDVGSGSGYLTVCMAIMLGTNGKTIGIDLVSQLIDESNNRIRQHFSHLTKSRIEFITCDGRTGYNSQSPYDVINIGGALDEVPQEIIDQLKPNGRLIVPLNDGDHQTLVTIDKTSSGGIEKKIRMRVRFGPITDLESQLRN